MNNFTLHLGDCLESLRGMPDCSVDAIVTDPPYGLSFMGKKWDYDVPGVDVWAECLRVLKPGGHLLAFAGTRTQHRMAVRIEDAGFEIRDMIAWVYGSGFPKSLDVSKAIDKAAGAEREVVGPNKFAQLNGQKNANCYGTSSRPDATDPATEAARHWQGWGTALKPALEPITVARKPLEGTVASNVLQHGTGALNVDGCRVGTQSTQRTGGKPMNGGAYGSDRAALESIDHVTGSDAGRWPANLILSDDPEVLAAFPQAKGQQGSLTGAEPSSKTAHAFGEFAGRAPSEPRGDTGSAARFFYCAKASRSDRNEGLRSGDTPAVAMHATMGDRERADWTSRNGNHHPTVKPTDLMAYLVRLVTPPGGVVLDPFMGSGSTGKAAMREGFDFVGCEMSGEYMEIARARIQHEVDKINAAAVPAPQLDMFA